MKRIKEKSLLLKHEDDKRDALEADVVAFNVIGIDNAYKRIVSTLEDIYNRSVNTDHVSPTESELSLLFNDSWSIIDRIYNMQSILPRYLKPYENQPNTKFFLQQSKTASLLRNKMDHIQNNIHNLAKTKDQLPPLFGIITCVCWNPEKMGERARTDLDSLVLSHSEFHHQYDFDVFPAEDQTFPISAPITNVRLHAFGRILDLSRAVKAALNVTDLIDQYKLNPPNPDRRFQVIIRKRYTSMDINF